MNPIENWYKVLMKRDTLKEPPKATECLHNNCPKCHGTGKDSSGKLCFHYLSCKCGKCSPGGL